MVAEDRIGKDLNSTVIRNLPKLLSEDFLRLIVEDSFAVHGTANHVIGRHGVLGRKFESGMTHGRKRVIKEI
jgi:hypothetical protein